MKTKRMKILFVGVIDVPSSSNTSMAKELRNLGHHVIDFNYRTISRNFSRNENRITQNVEKLLQKPYSLLRRFSTRSSLYNPYFSIQGRKAMNDSLERVLNSEKYDLVLFSKTDTVNFQTISNATNVATTLYYFMDPLFVAKNINAKEYANRCTWASSISSDVVKHFSQSNTNSILLGQGVDDQIFYPIPKKNTLEKDGVLFVGTKTKKRTQLVDFLIKNKIPIKCYGKGWNNKPIYSEALANLYRKAAIVLNFSQGLPSYSIRVYQATGCGAFLISEDSTDLAKAFEIGKEIETFNTKFELLGKIKHYLNNTLERNTIAHAGCNRTHTQYTWKHRMTSLIEMVQNNNSI